MLWMWKGLWGQARLGLSLCLNRCLPLYPQSEELQDIHHALNQTNRALSKSNEHLEKIRTYVGWFWLLLIGIPIILIVIAILIGGALTRN